MDSIEDKGKKSVKSDCFSVHLESLLIIPLIKCSIVECIECNANVYESFCCSKVTMSFVYNVDFGEIKANSVKLAHWFLGFIISNTHDGMI